MFAVVGAWPADSNWQAALASGFRATQLENACRNAGTCTSTRVSPTSPSTHPVACWPQAHQIDPRWKSSSGDDPGGLATDHASPSASHEATASSLITRRLRTLVLLPNVDPSRESNHADGHPHRYCLAE